MKRLKHTFSLFLLLVVWLACAAPAHAQKILYLDNLDSTRDLTRIAPIDKTRLPDIGINRSASVSQTPVFQKPFTITAGSTINTWLWVDDRNNNTPTRTARVELFNGRTGASLGLSEQTWNTNNGRQYLLFPITIGAAASFAVGDYVKLVVTNISATVGDDIRVESVRNGQNSQIEMQTSTVISVDSVQPYAAAYPATTQYLKYVQGSTVYIRAEISDPFGNADITSASLTMADANGSIVLNGVAMTFAGTPSAASRVYEYQYTIPAGAPSGNWNLSVTATEGYEGTVAHTAQDIMVVGNPDPVFDTSTKTVVDLNGGSPEPGDVLEYTITINETGGSNVSNAQVLDTVSADLTAVNIISIPPGATDNSAGNTIDISNISIPAAGTVSIVFRATIAPGTASGTGIDNTAVISHAASGVSYNAVAPTITVSAPDLSTSSKQVLDVNGAPALPGDVIRYTITINETGGNPATDVTLSDAVDSNYISINVISIPAGAVDNSIGNNIDIRNISVAANGSATVVFEASIIGSATYGTTIGNTAVITDVPTGVSVSVSAPTVLVGSAPTNGLKQLYLANLDTRRDLTRYLPPPPLPNATKTNDIGVNASVNIDMTPVFQDAFVIRGGTTVDARLWIRERGCRNPCVARVDLYHGGSGLYIASSTVQSWNGRANGGRNYIVFPISIGSAVSFSRGDFVRIVVTNLSPQAGDDFRIESERNGIFSQVRMQTDTVINVDAIDVYGNAYPSNTQYLKYVQGSTVSIRATVSDPFGNADITGATLTITDANGLVQINNALMTSVATPTGGTRVFEYLYTIPAGGVNGNWTLDVTATEGNEGTILHTAQGIMPVGNPDPILNTSTKSVVDLNGASPEPGDIIEYTITINETGGSNTSNVQVTDIVDANLTSVSVVSIPPGAVDNSLGNNIDVSGISLSPGGSASIVFRAVIVSGTPANTSIGNTATISHAASGVTFDAVAPVLIVSAPNLSTSSKTVLDVNGAPALVGDLLRYTITINESGGWPANNVRVTDSVSNLLTNVTVISIPPGAVNNSIGNSIDISNISIAANGSATIVFEGNIINTATVGDAIDNTASIVDVPTGASALATAGTVFVSSPPGSGDKQLYLDNLDTTPILTRVLPVIKTRPQNDLVPGATISISQSPVFQTPFTINGNIIVELWLRDRGGGGANRSARVDLYNGNTGVLIGSNTQSWSGRVYVVFTIPVAASQNFNAGDFIRLDLTNTSPGNNQDIRVESTRNGLPSQMTMPSSTVINVDAIDVYGVPYPGTTQSPSYANGSVVYIRATVSDPFGSADITSADITISDPTPTVRVNAQPMVSVATPTPSTHVFEYQYTIPATPEGLWNISITAHEGTEGTVSHTAQSVMLVSTNSPSLTVSKNSLVLSDPVNTTNPKAVPGAVLEYTIGVENSGFGKVDADTTVLTTTVSAGTSFFFGSPVDPATFVDGITPSGLTFTFSGLGSTTDDIDFSNDGGVTFITPAVDPAGNDITVPPINFIRFNPKGEFRASDGVNHPSMQIKYRVKVN